MFMSKTKMKEWGKRAFRRTKLQLFDFCVIEALKVDLNMHENTRGENHRG